MAWQAQNCCMTLTTDLTPVLERLLADVHAQLQKVIVQIFSVVTPVHFLAEVLWRKTDISALERVVENSRAKIIGSLVKVVLVCDLRQDELE